jgi:hypothetical protein
MKNKEGVASRVSSRSGGGRMVVAITSSGAARLLSINPRPRVIPAVISKSSLQSTQAIQLALGCYGLNGIGN